MASSGSYFQPVGGLIPSWAKDAKIGASCINARVETVDTKPAFRSAFKRRRCLVMADAYYEWRKEDKEPFYISRKSDGPMAFAGLWEFWKSPDGPVESCTIVTTEATESMDELHDRMPVILPPNDYDLWLDPEFQGKERLLSMLRPYPVEEMTAFPVSTIVKSPKNESPACIGPLG